MPDGGKDKKYCHGCGTMVSVYTMMSAGGEEDRCQVCSSIIMEEAPRSDSINLGRIYVVEDTTLLREMIKDIVLVKGLAEEVQACKNGAEFMSYLTRDLIRKNPPSLVMLDVVMPLLNGVNAAVAMRSVERAFGDSKIPILFFTVRPCDDTFRKILKYCTPAMFINKGQDASPDKMQTRVEAVVSQIWKEMIEK
jgi:CheY-like chemotaxis protein